jgi:hypothetical protein
LQFEELVLVAHEVAAAFQRLGQCPLAVLGQDDLLQLVETLDNLDTRLSGKQIQ